MTTSYDENQLDEIKYKNSAFKSELKQMFYFPTDKHLR